LPLPTEFNLFSVDAVFTLKTSSELKTPTQLIIIKDNYVNNVKHLKTLEKSSNGKIPLHSMVKSFFNQLYVLSTHSCDVTHSESFTASQTAYLK